VNERLLRASALFDLRRRDLWRVGVGVDAGYTSADHAATEEANDLDDLAHPRNMLRLELVETVDRVRRITRGERDAEGLYRHHRTMASWR
jgi:hypothetical protein